jgi:hypothetical protein
LMIEWQLCVIGIGLLPSPVVGDPFIIDEH